MLFIPGHRLREVQYGFDGVEQAAIPVILQDTPGPFNGVVLAVIRRIVSELNRHLKLRVLIAAINIKLRGHYSYYGITFNYYSLSRFRFEVVRSLYKWLNRRGGKRKWNWDNVTILVEQWDPLVKPLIYHSYGSTKRI